MHHLTIANVEDIKLSAATQIKPELHLETISSDLGGVIHLNQSPRLSRIQSLANLSIEGWISEAPSEARVLLFSSFGAPDSGQILASTNVSTRSDLPPNARYFIITLLVPSLLSNNIISIQLIASDEQYTLARIKIRCETPIDHISKTRICSIITAGRSGSTLLSKVFSQLPQFTSKSNEDGERSIFTSTFNSILDGFAQKNSSQVGTATGDYETFFNTPFLDNKDPLSSIYTLQFVLATYEIAIASADRYYAHTPPRSNAPIIVEKSWCRPLLPQIAARIGLRHIVLLRDPICIVNSIRQYYLRTGHRIRIDPLDDASLSAYVAKLCATLMFLAENIPCATIVRYEDLITDLPGQAHQLLLSLGLNIERTAVDTHLARLAEESSNSIHRTEKFDLSPEIQSRIRAECAPYIHRFYAT